MENLGGRSVTRIEGDRFFKETHEREVAFYNELFNSEVTEELQVL
jgi:hypothetical protein